MALFWKLSVSQYSWSLRCVKAWAGARMYAYMIVIHCYKAFVQNTISFSSWWLSMCEVECTSTLFFYRRFSILCSRLLTQVINAGHILIQNPTHSAWEQSFYPTASSKYKNMTFMTCLRLCVLFIFNETLQSLRIHSSFDSKWQL